jgi:hypothetical protein
LLIFFAEPELGAILHLVVKKLTKSLHVLRFRLYLGKPNV